LRRRRRRQLRSGYTRGRRWPLGLSGTSLTEPLLSSWACHTVALMALLWASSNCQGWPCHRRLPPNHRIRSTAATSRAHPTCCFPSAQRQLPRRWGRSRPAVPRHPPSQPACVRGNHYQLGQGGDRAVHAPLSPLGSGAVVPRRCRRCCSATAASSEGGHQERAPSGRECACGWRRPGCERVGDSPSDGSPRVYPHSAVERNHRQW